MRARILPLVAAGIAIGALALAGCATARPGGETPSPGPEISVVGTWLGTGNGEPHLSFKDDGTYTGTDGCNGLTGTYALDGDLVTLSPGLSTLRGCIGVDTWLRGAKQVKIDGTVLEIFNTSGDQIGTLELKA